MSLRRVSVCSMVGADAVFRWGPRARKVLLALSPTLLVPLLLYGQVVNATQAEGFWRTYFSEFRHVRNLYDHGEFFGNPNKRNYTRGRDIAEAYARVLPYGAHLWDDDSKGGYMFGHYHQQVLGWRPDVKLHLIFGPTMDAEKQGLTPFPVPAP